MSFEPREFLRHVATETDYLIRASAGVTREQFENDETLQRAVVRSLEIIGEATKLVPADLREKHSHIPWRAMARMRDRLIHHYFGVDLDLVWDVPQTKIPALRTQIEGMLKST